MDRCAQKKVVGGIGDLTTFIIEAESEERENGLGTESDNIPRASCLLHACPIAIYTAAV